MSNTWNFPVVMTQITSDFVEQQKIQLAYGLQQVIMRSPVDSGAYRSNHRISFGAPDDSPPETIRNTALRRGLGVISRRKAPFTVAYIQNNLPYSQELEQGSSQQAPNGIYRLTANDIAERYG